ncbi:16S rRNA (uracil1498-N3)-methyltransferase [Desulfuromusa kysingii]|uniref:Ribosomal RNA small subunit methyltransferase E n=1 Tax=Desulfuromusa kysingii TaxID=37625 RepID=A0A1H3XLJ4_9BACT|nr:16S rRNA (uracil(1498)-N(3))-methyltransferase [Desulfuromusa kysingii]SDZ99811.1 16S rRNA (uracil1498-N3)-methyltransferase [Desulfuromusa kysingii]
MRCFYLPESELCCGTVLPLPKELKRHLHTVLRLNPGEKVQFFNGFGLVATAILRANFAAEILQVDLCPAPLCSLTLIQGLPKGDKLELVLQKGTELGVNEFHLTPMERSVGSLKSDRKQKRLERWQKIVQEAARQCRQYHLPQLTADTTLTNALSTVDADLKLLLWEESAVPLQQVLPQSLPQRIAVLVGPEGGISQREAEQAQEQGYQSVSLGPRILRTETAGLAIMAILQYLYGDLASG